MMCGLVDVFVSPGNLSNTFLLHHLDASVYESKLYNLEHVDVSQLDRNMVLENLDSLMIDTNYSSI
jgi:hypothetical protein